MPDVVKLFYAAGTCSLAPHIALEETGAPFVPVPIDTKGGEHRRPDYLRINPKGRVPTLSVGEWVLTENVAILPFIAQTYPEARLWPEGTRAQGRALEWLGWLASTIHIAYAHVRRAERYAVGETALADVRAKGVTSCRELWPAVEQRLGEGPWALGPSYSVVDPYLLVFWTWGRGPALGLDMAREFPHWTAHARRMAERPAVQRTFTREDLPLPA